jgi:hypothetical protein
MSSPEMTSSAAREMASTTLGSRPDVAGYEDAGRFVKERQEMGKKVVPWGLTGTGSSISKGKSGQARDFRFDTHHMCR